MFYMSLLITCNVPRTKCNSTSYIFNTLFSYLNHFPSIYISPRYIVNYVLLFSKIGYPVGNFFSNIICNNFASFKNFLIKFIYFDYQIYKYLNKIKQKTIIKVFFLNFNRIYLFHNYFKHKEEFKINHNNLIQKLASYDYARL